MLSGEIPTWIKKEWGVYKKKESNRAKAGKSPIASYESLVFYGSITLHKNIGYDGVGIFAGEGDYITNLSDKELEQLLTEIKRAAEIDLVEQKSRKDFKLTHSKSQLYPAYLNVRNPLTYDYEGTQ